MAITYNDHSASEFGRTDSMEESLRPPTAERSVYGASLSKLSQTILVAILLLGLLFASLDASIVSTSLVSISLNLQNFIDAPWVVLSYLLAYMGLAIGFAKMSDIYGRRALLITAWLLFAGFSIGCGLAQNMAQLIVFRTFQGIGGSGLYSLAQIGLFEVGPSHKPGLMGALVGMTLAMAFVLGPILGGTISYFSSWRWIFFINVPFGAIALVGLIFVWPPGITPRGSVWDGIRSIDFPGNILIIAASLLLVFALQQGASFNYSWDSPVIIIILSIAALSWVVFLTWELFIGLKRDTHIQAVLPLRLVTVRPYLAALMYVDSRLRPTSSTDRDRCTLCSGFSYLAIIIILPERFQIVNGDDALMGGIHLLPMLGACAFGSFLAGLISSKRNNTSFTLIAAACLQLIGIGLLSTLSDTTTEIQAQYGYQAVFGLGVGLSFAGATMLTLVQSRSEDLAVAQGAIAQARVLGGAIGIAVCSVIFNTQVTQKLAGVLDEADMKALQQSPLISAWLSPEQQTVIREVYASAFTDDVKTMICIAAVSLAASFVTFELHPPSMPGGRVRKEQPVDSPRAGSSETELEDLGSSRYYK